MGIATEIMNCGITIVATRTTLKKSLAWVFLPSRHQSRRVLPCGDQSMGIIRTETHCVLSTIAHFFSKIKNFL